MLNPQEQQWLEESLSYLSVQGMPDVEVVVGDASARNYYRIKLGARNFILCRSKDEASNQRFRKVSAALEQVGVMAPLVFAFDDDLGLMLMSDMGRTQLIEVYQMNAHAHPYSIIHRVLNDLIRLSQIPDPLLMQEDQFLVGRYDQALLARDFGLFTEWCIEKALGVTLFSQEKESLLALARQFESAFNEQPQVWVHRDFHSRNLMLTDDDVAVIDFQDMVKGPICYDLISLVFDAYWLIPMQDQKNIIDDFYRLLCSESLIDVSREDFQRWVAATAMQRLIKILGIFCRLSLRDGKTQYLADLPMVIHHIETLHQSDAGVWPEDWLLLWKERLRPALNAFLARHEISLDLK